MQNVTIKKGKYMVTTLTCKNFFNDSILIYFEDYLLSLSC